MTIMCATNIAYMPLSVLRVYATVRRLLLTVRCATDQRDRCIMLFLM